MTNFVVFYHSPCMDGFAAAWAAHRCFGDRAEYIGVNYGKPFPLEKCDGRTVYFVDFSLKRGPMSEVVARSHSVTILDHHKTAEAELAGIKVREHDVVVFDMEKSGARLAWEHFHDTPVPRLIEYVEDRDLWRFQLKHSELVSDWLSAYAEDDFETWDLIAIDIDDNFETVLRDAGVIRAYKDRAIELALPNAHPIEFDGHVGLAVNQSSANLISEIAGALAERATFGACYYRKPDGEWVVSLRSRSGGLDVSEIASRRGGGGHAGAAGFQCAEPPAIATAEATR